MMETDGLIARVALAALANGLTALVIAYLVRDAWRFLAARLAVPLFIGTIGYSLMSLPATAGVPDAVLAVAVLANIPTLGLNWLFGRALLQDGFRLGWPEWAVLAVTCALMLALALPDLAGVRLPGHETIRLVMTAVSLVIMGHILWIAISGFSGDLVDSRRKVRIGFVVFVLATYAVILAEDLAGLPFAVQAVSYDLATLAINLAILAWALRFRPERIFTPPADPAAPPVPPARLKPREARAHDRLVALMEVDRLYREPALSIRGLAERVGVPEHQLRALINRSLGHRNFPAFLNGYRIAEAKAALADPDQAGVPILTIALDSGFATLSTFNRAFRSLEGETPSAFRQRALAGG